MHDMQMAYHCMMSDMRSACATAYPCMMSDMKSDCATAAHSLWSTHSPGESAYVKQLRANSLLPTTQSMRSGARVQRLHMSRLAKPADLVWAAIQHVLAVQPEMQLALVLVCKAGQRWEAAPRPEQLWLLKGDAVKSHLLHTTSTLLLNTI